MNQCLNCRQTISGEPYLAAPARHLTSPNPAGFKLPFCDKACSKAYNQEAMPFWAELDRNASDSQCFVHDHWERDDLHRHIRVGHCKITGQPVRVEPLQPGNNSGQPIECYEHWTLRTTNH